MTMTMSEGQGSDRGVNDALPCSDWGPDDSLCVSPLSLDVTGNGHIVKMFGRKYVQLQ